MTSILLIGGGPAALAAAVALRCHGVDASLEVVDPAGEWLAAWRRRFAHQDIACLRSPAVHHPHPDPFALLGHEGRDGLVPSGGTYLPTTARFLRFVDHLVAVHGLGEVVVPTTATDLVIDDRGSAEVTLADGTRRRPDHVVMCTNTRRQTWPAALRPLCGDAVVQHSETADVREVHDGERVLVVGGGLSAAHLAIGAARRGALVTMVTRRRILTRRFDVHPSWLGPKKRRPFELEPDPHRRRIAIVNARGGGTVPPRVHRDLVSEVAHGRVELRERVDVVGATLDGDRCRVHLHDGSTVAADRVWAATGGVVDVGDDPLCAELVGHAPLTIAGGLPDLPPDLRWPGTNVHLTGLATALRLGPTAGNLVGHRRAALRLVASLTGGDPTRDDRPYTAGGVTGPARALP
ncbi:MAG: SidA/IucD/PvdA family monooxygenase [Actinobacteria bacterium]|jgi:cation diffusion facilitator CzcD-associated flavoprotein CzcO|nr:SidA/IucD/PvdA family monooxygenase [Actinomycetota bacterium]